MTYVYHRQALPVNRLFVLEGTLGRAYHWTFLIRNILASIFYGEVGWGW